MACCKTLTERQIDLMYRRHHAAMLGVQAIALYALVICDHVRLAYFWQLPLTTRNPTQLTPQRGGHNKIMTSIWSIILTVYMIAVWAYRAGASHTDLRFGAVIHLCSTLVTLLEALGIGWSSETNFANTCVFLWNKIWPPMLCEINRQVTHHLPMLPTTTPYLSANIGGVEIRQ